jgi:protein-tyrosine phosphatase
MMTEEQKVTVPSRIVYAKFRKELGKLTVTFLGQAVECIEAHIADRRFLVCCRAGMARSSSVVIASLCRGR